MLFASSLDDRLRDLLRLVVEDVIETGEPVGSQRLTSAYQLSVSPATIRNWFAELEAHGLLMQPHTSAGRVPTEAGYRFYLDQLMDEPILRARERAVLERAARDQERLQMLKAMAKALAESTGDVAIVWQQGGEVFATGWSQLFSQPEFQVMERVLALSQVLDHVHEVMTQLEARDFDQPTALIGRDCPFDTECSSIVMNMEGGLLVGLLGPLRMDYRRGFSLLRATRHLLRELH